VHVATGTPIAIKIGSNGVVDDAAASDRKVTIQYRREIAEKLATAALRAGISLEELVHLIDSGITPDRGSRHHRNQTYRPHRIEEPCDRPNNATLRVAADATRTASQLSSA
jgi:hypothetical protein